MNLDNAGAIAANIDWKALTSEILGLLKDETKDLWKKEDTAFLQELANTIVKEKALAMAAPDEAKRKEHEQNLLHLAAQVQGEIAIRGLEIQDRSKELFVRVLGAIIRTVVVAALQVPASKGTGA